MTDEYPIYVLSRHNRAAGDPFEEGHPCCVCTREDGTEKEAAPIYGYEVTRFVGLQNAKPDDKVKYYDEDMEVPELVAGGTSRDAMVAVLRLIGAERVQDFTVERASWSDPAKHWSEL